MRYIISLTKYYTLSIDIDQGIVSAGDLSLLLIQYRIEQSEMVQKMTALKLVFGE